MLPANQIDYAIGLLMKACSECKPFEFDPSDMNRPMFYSTAGNQYGLAGTWKSLFDTLAAKVAKHLDEYPVTDFLQTAQSWIADIYELRLPRAGTKDPLQQRLTTFFGRIAKPDAWHVLLAVTGLAMHQPPFSVGRGEFFVMDETQLHLWALRRGSVHFSPPATTRPRGSHNNLDAQLLGNWVARLKVRAIDTGHATAKAKTALEEILNVLRHGGFHFSIPQHYLRQGLGSPQPWNSQSMCVRVAPPGGFQDSLGDGAKGFDFSLCHWIARAWAALQTVICKEPADRTSVESLVMEALEWVGQAAAAPRPTVRLVSLVTAIEILVLQEDEALGKKAKLSRRVATVVQELVPEYPTAETDAIDLYRLRSECLHEGLAQIEEKEITKAYQFVDCLVTVFLTREPYCGSTTFADLIRAIDAKSAPSRLKKPSSVELRSEANEEFGDGFYFDPAGI